MSFTTIRVPSQFARWLKGESKRRGTTMVDLIESLAENGLGGGKPWERLLPSMPLRRRTARKRKHKHR